MDRKIKKLWLKALRSGEYKQGRNQLRMLDHKDQESFCCLGVLCNLHAQAHPELAQYEMDPETYLGESGTLPPEVARWAGISQDDEQDGIDVPVKLTRSFRGSSQNPIVEARESFNKLGKLNKDGTYSTWTLAMLNDHGAGFNQIADVIEECL